MGNLCVPVTRPLAAVPYVDLKKYSGLWWQIGVIPNGFQRSDDTNVTATYTISRTEPGVLEVENRAWRVPGHPVSIHGRARIDPVAAETDTSYYPGRLVVEFDFSDRIPGLTTFPSPYWIIDLGTNASGEYTWSVVSEPSRRFLWILSRTPQMDIPTITYILSRIQRVHGFSSDRLLTMIWTNNTPLPDAPVPAPPPQPPAPAEITPGSPESIKLAIGAPYHTAPPAPQNYYATPGGYE
jgi:apolipoprotein D and lipocalin family protein